MGHSINALLKNAAKCNVNSDEHKKEVIIKWKNPHMDGHLIVAHCCLRRTHVPSSTWTTPQAVYDLMFYGGQTDVFNMFVCLSVFSRSKLYIGVKFL